MKKFKIGDLIISNTDTSHGKGAILQIASANWEGYWCHGIKNVGCYRDIELVQLRNQYREGNFGVWFTELNNWDLYKEFKKEIKVFGIVKFTERYYK